MNDTSQKQATLVALLRHLISCLLGPYMPYPQKKKRENPEKPLILCTVPSVLFSEACLKISRGL